VANGNAKTAKRKVFSRFTDLRGPIYSLVATPMLFTQLNIYSSAVQHLFVVN